MEDSRIVDLYLARDESAIKHSAEKYGARLHGISLGIVNDPRTAEECENDVYSEAWRLIPPNEPRDYLFAFLARIARSLSLKRCRSERALKRSANITELSHEMQECVPSGASVEAQADCTLLGEAISRFLYSQPQEKRELFIRRYWYLDSISALAESFGFSESKVKVTLSRLRAQLKKHLESEGYSV